MTDYATFSILLTETLRERGGGALGLEAGEFLAAYEGVWEEAHETALDASPIAFGASRAIGQAVLSLMEEGRVWDGTPDALLQKLATLVDEKVKRSKAFPADSTRLSKALTRLAPDRQSFGSERRAIGLFISDCDRWRFWSEPIASLAP